jgi:hypothetical protein
VNVLDEIPAAFLPVLLEVELDLVLVLPGFRIEIRKVLLLEVRGQLLDSRYDAPGLLSLNDLRLVGIVDDYRNRSYIDDAVLGDLEAQEVFS